MKQKTIKKPVHLSGIGIHSGAFASVNILPADPDYGIVFFSGKQTVKAGINNVTDNLLGTSLCGIIQVEHLLSAAAGLGIGNLRVELEGQEIPALDGSSRPFVDAFVGSGIIEFEAEAKEICLSRPVRAEDGDKFIEAFPADSLTIDFMVDYPIIGAQQYFFAQDPAGFASEIAPARTFGFKDELEKIKKSGRGLGASLENALGIDANGYMNQPRYKDEPVRHKILDLIGDLALLGQPLKANIKAHKSSHKLNHELARRILHA